MTAIERERAAFVGATALGLAVTLLPIWQAVFPPLQDYPYHLAQVAVLLRAGDPASPFAAHFSGDLALRPYAAFYLLTTGLGQLLPLEVAGRAALSVPALLLGGLLLGGLRRGDAPPWGALVLLPLSLGLSHYLGFVNYLWSLPLLGLALEDLARLADAEGGRAVGPRLGAWIVGLFLTHPFTFLAFLALGALRLALAFRAAPPAAAPRAAAVLALAAALFGVWFVAAGAGRPALGPEGVHWLSPARSASLLTLPFTGMRGGSAVAGAPLALWLALGALALAAGRADPGAGARARFWWLAAALCAIASFAAPFRMGHYSYVNARIPEIAFLCLGVALGGIRFRGAARAALVALVAAALALSSLQQRRVADELAEVAPLLARIPGDAAVLPLVFDDDSPELAPAVFDPHLHVHHYVHVRGGGGVTPYFFPHPLAPVRYRPGNPPAAPPVYRPGAYDPERHDAWDWLLVRAAPPRFLRALERTADEVAVAGPWRLLRRRDAGSRLPTEEPPARER